MNYNDRKWWCTSRTELLQTFFQRSVLRYFTSEREGFVISTENASALRYSRVDLAKEEFERYLEFKRGTRLGETRMAMLPEQPVSHGVSPIVYVSEKTVWQYKYVTRDLSQGNFPNEDELNQWGKDGWELVFAFNHADALHMYFKRIKP